MSNSVMELHMDTKTKREVEAIQHACSDICKAAKKMRDKMVHRLRRSNGMDNMSRYSGSSFNSLSSIDDIKQLRFVKGNINLKLIQSMLGKLEIVEDGSRPFTLETVSKFNWANWIPVDLIAATPSGNAWVCDSNAKLSLVNEIGNILFSKKLKFVPESLAVDDNHTVYFTCFAKRKVMKLAPYGEITSMADTSPLHPVGIYMTGDGGFLLSLVANLQVSKKGGNDRKIVKVLVDDQKEVKTEVFTPQSTMYSFPYRVIENINGDVIVVDALTNISGRIIVLTEEGAEKFCYTGDDPNEDHSVLPFSPTNLCRDLSGNILVIDGNSGHIHVIGSDGILKQKIKSSEISSGMPTTISFSNDGCLWIGHASGEITVHKYAATSFDENDSIEDSEPHYHQSFHGHDLEAEMLNQGKGLDKNFILSSKKYESVSGGPPLAYRSENQYLDPNSYDDVDAKSIAESLSALEDVVEQFDSNPAQQEHHAPPGGSVKSLRSDEGVMSAADETEGTEDNLLSTYDVIQKDEQPVEYRSISEEEQFVHVPPAMVYNEPDTGSSDYSVPLKTVKGEKHDQHLDISKNKQTVNVLPSPMVKGTEENRGVVNQTVQITTNNVDKNTPKVVVAEKNKGSVGNFVRNSIKIIENNNQQTQQNHGSEYHPTENVLSTPVDKGREEKEGFIGRSVQETIKNMEENLKKRAIERENRPSSGSGDDSNPEEFAKIDFKKKYFKETALAGILNASLNRNSN